MRVAFIGGLDRLESALVETGAAVGVDVEVHHGDVHGRGAAGLANVIGRADHVVVVTGTNSHGGVQMAKKLARKSGARVWIVRSCGLAVAKQFVEEAGAATDEGLRRLARSAA
ncbi:MAG: DUF2325 domain-containing protein [Polyangiales bacterium]